MNSNARQIEPFENEQAYLAAQVRSGNFRLVFLDPDGTLHCWLAVVVRSETGVVYGNQCEGVAMKQRLVEGYLVLLGGWKYDVDGGMIDLTPLTEAFHKVARACMWSWLGRELPSERFAELNNLVKGSPIGAVAWKVESGLLSARLVSALNARTLKLHLRIDADRVEQIAEAWIPVETSDGPGVLLYKNCD